MKACSKCENNLAIFEAENEDGKYRHEICESCGIIATEFRPNLPLERVSITIDLKEDD